MARSGETDIETSDTKNEDDDADADDEDHTAHK
jgi:hypothetical protein